MKARIMWVDLARRRQLDAARKRFVARRNR
jgi:hypothetical protein